MPSNLRCKFSEILAEKRPDIEQESIGRMSIIPGSKVYLQRADFYEKHKGLFSDSIYEKDYPVERYEAFISKIEPKQIFEKLKYFYLGKEDEEFLEWDKKLSQPCLTKISEEDDFLEKMAKLSIQTNFVKMINEIGSRGDLAELENDGIFESPIKKENPDLCQITHLTENRIKRYNINGTKRV